MRERERWFNGVYAVQGRTLVHWQWRPDLPLGLSQLANQSQMFDGSFVKPKRENQQH